MSPQDTQDESKVLTSGLGRPHLRMTIHLGIQFWTIWWVSTSSKLKLPFSLQPPTSKNHQHSILSGNHIPHLGIINIQFLPLLWYSKVCFDLWRNIFFLHLITKERDPLKKKNVFFRALPELPKPPPPHDPNSGNLVLFFRKSKFKIWKSV